MVPSLVTDVRQVQSSPILRRPLAQPVAWATSPPTTVPSHAHLVTLVLFPISLVPGDAVVVSLVLFKTLSLNLAASHVKLVAFQKVTNKRHVYYVLQVATEQMLVKLPVSNVLLVLHKLLKVNCRATSVLQVASRRRASLPVLSVLKTPHLSPLEALSVSHVKIRKSATSTALSVYVNLATTDP